MTRLVSGVVGLVLALCVWTLASPPLPVESHATPFVGGDRVCFIGDSITSGGIYHSYVQLFYATRYPDRDIVYFNCGHSGGYALECQRRLSWDVLEHKPTVAVVSFGMNDMSGLFGAPDRSPAEVQKAMQERMGHVQADYAKVLDQLSTAGARLVLVGSSIYDDTAKLDAKVERSNLAMTLWTEQVGKIAAQRHADFIDLGAVMNPINVKLQASDPKATIIGTDRVHPGAVGHAVMAYAILKAQNVQPDVSRIVVDAISGGTGGSYNCTIADVQRGNTGLKFSCREMALPFVLPEEASQALDLVPLTKELNRELLVVSGLPRGRYVLHIDGQQVGAYGNGDLAAGINLASNTRTPQYQQAAALARLNRERNTIESRHFRAKTLVRINLLEPAGVNLNDSAAVEHFLMAGIENKSFDNFNRAMAQHYLKDVAPHWDQTVEHHKSLLVQMTTQRQPKPHQFDLQIVGMSVPGE